MFSFTKNNRCVNLSFEGFGTFIAERERERETRSLSNIFHELHIKPQHVFSTCRGFFLSVPADTPVYPYYSTD